MQPVMIVRFGGSKSAVGPCCTRPAAVGAGRRAPLGWHPGTCARVRPQPAPELV